MTQITIQGISVEDFLAKVEDAAYRGQMKAIEHTAQNEKAVNWDRYGDLMSVKDVAGLFSKQMDTVRRWIRDGRFGEYTKGRPHVLKINVKRVFEAQLRSNKR